MNVLSDEEIRDILNDKLENIPQPVKVGHAILFYPFFSSYVHKRILSGLEGKASCRLQEVIIKYKNNLSLRGGFLFLVSGLQSDPP